MRKLAWYNVKDDSFKVQLSKIVNISITRWLPATSRDQDWCVIFTLLQCSSLTNKRCISLFKLDKWILLRSLSPTRDCCLEIQAWIIWVGHQNISMALYTIGSPIITNMKMDPNSRAVVTVSQGCLNVRKVLWEDNNSVDTTLIEASSSNLSNANF